MGTSLLSCVEMRIAIERLFGMVNVLGPGIDVLDGVHVPQGEGAVSGMVSGIFRQLRPPFI